jgi:hypothetical protein
MALITFATKAVERSHSLTPKLVDSREPNGATAPYLRKSASIAVRCFEAFIRVHSRLESSPYVSNFDPTELCIS